MKNYNLNDYELLYLISENNEEVFEIILKKYTPLITSIAVKYFSFYPNVGLTLDDFIQEGRIALFFATKRYDFNSSVFYTLALACINNLMKKAIRTATSGKNKNLNFSVSLDDIKYIENIGCTLKNPEQILIEKEMLIDRINFKNSLDDLNSQVFELRTNGFSYKEISIILDIPTKKVDNCLSSVKKTLKKCFNPLP